MREMAMLSVRQRAKHERGLSMRERAERESKRAKHERRLSVKETAKHERAEHERED